MHKNPKLRDELRPEIKYSWERSYDLGVDPYLRENAYICTQNELREARERYHYLLSSSEPVMRDLNEFVAGTGFVTALVDPELRLLRVIGDEEALEWAKSAHFVEGSMWAEDLVGTNAGALCQTLSKPISVFGYEHYCLFSHVAASSCAPIIDNGIICGCLSLAAPFNKVTNHTLGMVVAATKHIASSMLLGRVNLYLTTIMGSMSEGVLALDPNGKITFVNSTCAQALQTSQESLVGSNILDILGPQKENHYFINKVTQGRTIIDENFKLTTVQNKIINCNITCNPLTHPEIDGGTVIIIKEIQRINRLVQKWVGDGAKLNFEDIIGHDSKFVQTLTTARTAAATGSNVLLLGESGTGKDIIAQAMHNASPRYNNPYIAINCAALPRELIASELFGYEEGAFTGARKGGCIGKFELANQGTIFLDEIGDMPLDLQASLLRVLEEKKLIRLGGTRLIPINVRIIAATNKDLQNEVKRQRFRRDLYYRLAVISLAIPPLRERPNDIIVLAEELIKRTCRRFDKPIKNLSPEVVQMFLSYSWPGNVRELQNVIEGAIQLAPGDIITLNLVSDYLIREEFDLQHTIDEPDLELIASDIEKNMLINYLIKYKYNKSEIAKALGISRKTLYKRLSEFDLL